MRCPSSRLAESRRNKMKKYVDGFTGISVLIILASAAVLCFLNFSSGSPRTVQVFSFLQQYQLFDFGQAGQPHSEARVRDMPSALSSSPFILKLLAGNGTQECHNVSTATAKILGLPQPMSGLNGDEIVLTSDVLHKFWIDSYDANGTRRCYGGDFYETELEGENWKARPPVTDLGNGSYLVEVRVDGAFAGVYTFKATLLFSNFHGLEQYPNGWALLKELFSFRIRFTSTVNNKQFMLPVCTSNDFKSETKWTGQWIRRQFNASCELDGEGRYRCFDENEACDPALCSGGLAGLESNGWVYTAHCKFRIWSKEQAWKCLDGKKLLFWGDSNHQDTIRNLMNFVLGLNQDTVDRNYIVNLTNPANPAQMIQIFSLFNGHTNPMYNVLGLGVLYVPEYRSFITEYFFRNGPPHAVVLNSGLHDAAAWNNSWQFTEAAEKASIFWETLLRLSVNRPRIVYRTTVTPCGVFRSGPINPQKMEAYNQILENKMQRRLGDLDLQFVDAYDMSFPWHFGMNYSDGVHYGRSPSLSPWFGRIGHFYFVDLMLVHVLLTSICD